MSNPDQSPALSLEEFRHWLNNRRMMDVSMAFGDIVERYREATEAAAMAATVPAELVVDGHKGEEAIRRYVATMARTQVLNQWLADVYGNELRKLYAERFASDSPDAEMRASNKVADLWLQRKDYLAKHWPEEYRAQYAETFPAEHCKITESLMASLHPTQAPVAGQPAEPSPPHGLTPGQIGQLLQGSLKPEEINGAPDVRHQRVRELLHWFARFQEGHANPKWAKAHAMELAYYIATTGPQREVNVSAINQAGYLEGLRASPEDRAMMERIGALAAPKGDSNG